MTMSPKMPTSAIISMQYNSGRNELNQRDVSKLKINDKQNIGVKYFVFCLYIWSRHNENDGVWNHQPHDCLLNRLFRRRSKKTSKLRVTGLCAGNSPVTDEFPTQRASYAENIFIWWRHHDMIIYWLIYFITCNFTRFQTKCRQRCMTSHDINQMWSREGIDRRF